MKGSNLNQLIRQAENGDIAACLELMRQYAHGSNNVFRDPITAKQWGYLALKLKGEALPTQHVDKKSFSLLKEKAENNDVESCIQLALYYATGTSFLFKDLSIARKLIDRAVSSYSTNYSKSGNESKKKKRQEQPIEYPTIPTEDLKKMAERGDDIACSELSQRFASGIRGVFKDILEADKWREKARKISGKSNAANNYVNFNKKEKAGKKEKAVTNTIKAKPDNFGKKDSETLKGDISSKYQELDALLDSCIEDIQKLHFENKEFVKLKKDLASNLETTIAVLKEEVESNSRNARWDKLVIAFFGETNAGKSTIIETFRILFDSNRKKNTDGLIVGDGQHDFTKDYNEYNLSINGHPFVLIDVPGIEGNEKEFKDVIQEALSKAHCVFYVQGHNKKPDAGTAEKIKKYLGDWAIVYSIQNVRGSVTNYDEEEERETLLTPGVIKNEGLIKESFRAILGNVYKGNITVQALLAMCARASFSNDTEYLQSLIRSQKKLIKYFGSAEKILEFSQFQTLINTVDSKSQNFKEEIAEANQQKYIALTRKIQKMVDNVIQGNKEGTDFKLKKLKDFRQSVNSQMTGLASKVESRVKSCIRQRFNALEIRLDNKLDSDCDQEEKKQFIRNQIRYFPTELRQRLTEEAGQQIQFVKNQLISQARRIEGVDFSRSLSFNINVSFTFDIDNLEDGLSELDVNLEDVGDVVGSIAKGAFIGSFIPGVGTAIGAAVGAGLGAIGSLGSKAILGDGGVASAKESIGNVINKAQKSAENKVRNDISTIRNQANRRRTLLLQQVDEEIHSVERINEIVDDLNDGIKNIINQ